MSNKPRIALAQLNFSVGDIRGNTQKILTTIDKARDKLHADLIVFPELAITSYPLEDLLHRPSLHQQAANALVEITQKTHDIDVLISYPELTVEGGFNTAAWIREGQIIAKYYKQKLPNYGVFDEVRYFKPGNQPCTVELKGIRFGILICEDIWFPEPIQEAKAEGAEAMICLNASPYSMHKYEQRQAIVIQRSQETGLPILYLNLIGGQDELIFDGGSFAVDRQAQLAAQAPFFKETELVIEFDDQPSPIQQVLSEPRSFVTNVYDGLVLGIRDYVNKNHFKGVLIGLSGGIDSALTLALAVDALGADRVTGLLMPSQYTSSMSIEDAEAEAKNLSISYHTIPIESIYNAFLTTLEPVFKKAPLDITEENIQARIRGTLLMAVSNKTGDMVLSTGNKSEMAVGYATLYGDMVGGFCALKDIFKTLVYKLAEYRNTISPVIPRRVIDRPPSAELAPNQLDQDSLPPYDILDKILEYSIEQDKSPTEIIELGFNKETVDWVVKMVQRNEYKRRQAPPGVKISAKAFGRDRRYPITSGFTN